MLAELCLVLLPLDGLLLQTVWYHDMIKINRDASKTQSLILSAFKPQNIEVRLGGEILNTLQLNTFIHVADAGSFNKAAEELFISPPAIIKQINTMESELGVTLFVRTHNGLALTDAGKSFYKDAVYLLHYFQDSIERAKTASEKNDYILKIGTSPMTPGQFLTDLWPQIHPYLPNMKFRFVPFENRPEIAREIQRDLGKKIDMVVGVLDENYLRERGCWATELSVEPIRIAVPVRHHLADKTMLSMKDLAGENLMLIQRGWNSYIDALRDDLIAYHPQIHLTDFSFYGMEAYNQCEMNNCLIMTIDPWKDIHPLLKVLPVEWNYTIPFGILHAKEPSENVMKFLTVLRQVLDTKQ